MMKMSLDLGQGAGRKRAHLRAPEGAWAPSEKPNREPVLSREPVPGRRIPRLERGSLLLVATVFAVVAWGMGEVVSIAPAEAEGLKAEMRGYVR